MERTGAPLSPGTGYQYYSGPATENNAIYHNQVKLGRRDVQECFGRVDTTVTDYGFGPNADYAVGSRFYPSQIFADGKGSMSWNRHVLFLKSAQANGPSYFVMRDTFPAEVKRPSWWEWMNLDTAERAFFGHDEDGSVTVSEAVQASTALPGFYKPARLNGIDYVDGGVRRTANNDVAIEHQADLIICYNPFRPFSNRIRRTLKDGKYEIEGQLLSDTGVLYNRILGK